MVVVGVWLSDDATDTTPELVMVTVQGGINVEVTHAQTLCWPDLILLQSSGGSRLVPGSPARLPFY